MRTRATNNGYTVIELMMSLTVLALSASGVIAMQRVTLESNRYAKDLAIATRVGEAWADQLEADSALWSVLSPISNTTWLKESKTCSQNAPPTKWFEPKWNSDRRFGPAFDALGNPLDTSVSIPDSYTQFCVHLRMAWLYCDQPVAGGGMKGNGVIRTEIRVFWRRDDDALVTNPGTFQTVGQAKLCEESDADNITADILASGYNAVYLSTAIREVPQ